MRRVSVKVWGCLRRGSFDLNDRGVPCLHKTKRDALDFHHHGRVVEVRITFTTTRASKRRRSGK